MAIVEEVNSHRESCDIFTVLLANTVFVIILYALLPSYLDLINRNNWGELFLHFQFQLSAHSKDGGLDKHLLLAGIVAGHLYICRDADVQDPTGILRVDDDPGRLLGLRAVCSHSHRSRKFGISAVWERLPDEDIPRSGLVFGSGHVCFGADSSSVRHNLFHLFTGGSVLYQQARSNQVRPGRVRPANCGEEEAIGPPGLTPTCLKSFCVFFPLLRLKIIPNVSLSTRTVYQA